VIVNERLVWSWPWSRERSKLPATGFVAVWALLLCWAFLPLKSEDHVLHAPDELETAQHAAQAYDPVVGTGTALGVDAAVVDAPTLVAADPPPPGALSLWTRVILYASRIPLSSAAKFARSASSQLVVVSSWAARLLGQRTSAMAREGTRCRRSSTLDQSC
jgi:hypothetical protein